MADPKTITIPLDYPVTKLRPSPSFSNGPPTTTAFDAPIGASNTATAVRKWTSCGPPFALSRRSSAKPASRRGDAMKQKTKPALRVVAGNPHIRRRQPRRPPDMLAMILPPINLFQKKNLDSHAFECEAMGLTNWQVNRAWQLVNPSYARFDEYVQATNRVFLLWQALEKAFEQERREVLAVLQEHHPAVVRKIMKSLKPKS